MAREKSGLMIYDYNSNIYIVMDIDSENIIHWVSRKFMQGDSNYFSGHS